MGLSTDHILNATVKMVRELKPDASGDYLDVGAGHGQLIELMRRQLPGLRPRACDYRNDLIHKKGLGEGVTVDVVNLNESRLPYGDDSFDVITCTEVIEHLEQFRGLCREFYRVLRPGGAVVLTTPNILNLKSRLRFLTFGFYNLFGPLRFHDEDLHNPTGHINPVGYFYIAHALRNAGFQEIRVAIDRAQRSSRLIYWLLWPFLRSASAFALRKERQRYRTIDDENEQFVRQMNSRLLLAGRTLIVGCRREGVR